MRPLFALFIRSIREDFRAKLPPILRAILVLIILLIIWANHRSFSWKAAPGREFFMMVMLLNTGFIGLLALSIFPSAIAEEKEDDTLTLLRMTNLGALSILMGKGASRLFAALLLIAVQIPFTLLGIALGGVSMDQILFSYAILGATTVFLCSVALAASVYCRTAIRAGFLTGTISGILFFLLPILAIATAVNRMNPATMVATTFYEHLCIGVIKANPVYALVMLFESPGRSVLVTDQLWIMLGGSVVFFLIAWALFGRYCANAEDTAGRPRASKAGRAKPRRFAVGRPGRWPLAWKDWHFMIGGKSGFLLRLVLAAAIFGGGYFFTRYVSGSHYFKDSSPAEFVEYFWREVAEMTITFACMCGALELLLVTGRIFGAEYRRQTLSSLVALPVKVGRIIRQKIAGCLPCLLPWLLLATVGLIAHPVKILPEGANDLLNLRKDAAAALLYGVSQALLLITLIAWFSLKIRRGALPASIAIIGGWNIVWGVFMDDVINVSRDSETSVLFASAALSTGVLIFMARLVYRRIQTAAAEDS